MRSAGFIFPFQCPGFCLVHCFLHSFQRSTDFPRYGDSFGRSITHTSRPITATRRVSTFPLPDRLPLLWKEGGLLQFHLPKVGKCATAPRAYCSHVCRYIMPIPPSEGEKFPAFYAHLPKVGKGHTAPRAYCSYVFRYILPIPPSEGEKFPAFYAHLPKVGKGHTAPRAYCCHVCRYILPIQPSEGEKFPRVLCTPSEGDPALFPCIVKALSRDTAKVQPFRHYTAA